MDGSTSTLSSVLSVMPWWAGLIAVVITGVGSHFATRMTSKDRVQANLVTQTVKRQEQLDERQNQMMDDLTGEITRLRDELLLVRQELNTERHHARLLSTEMECLKEENRKLNKENVRLQEQVSKLESELKKVQNCERARVIREEGCTTNSVGGTTDGAINPV